MHVPGSSVLVTGGACGLGRATAHRLAASGAHVTVVDLAEEPGAEVARSVGGTFVAADVTHEDQMRSAVATAVDHGPLRAVVHCAGGPGGTASWTRTDAP